MEFEGIVYRKLPIQKGTSSRGEWQKQEVVFELPNDYQRKVCVTFFGDKAAEAAPLNEGDTATVSFHIESREYNGRWFTDIRGWRVVRKSADGEPARPVDLPPLAAGDAPDAQAPSAAESFDDLPF